MVVSILQAERDGHLVRSARLDKVLGEELLVLVELIILALWACSARACVRVSACVCAQSVRTCA